MLYFRSCILDVVNQVVHIFAAQLDVVLLAKIIHCTSNLAACVFSLLRSKNHTECCTCDSAAKECTNLT